MKKHDFYVDIDFEIIRQIFKVPFISMLYEVRVNSLEMNGEIEILRKKNRSYTKIISGHFRNENTISEIKFHWKNLVILR